jgi:hypothetical protein
VIYLALGRRKICEPFARLDEAGMQMRTSIAIAVVVAIGLIWSVAALSEWVPVNSADMRSAAISPHAITLKQGESASAE